MDIEKRAKEKSKIYCRQYRHNAKWLGEDFVYSNEEIELACKDIATEQKQLDIDKACDYLCTTCRKRGIKKGAICIEVNQSCYKIKDFRKAMES